MRSSTFNMIRSAGAGRHVLRPGITKQRILMRAAEFAQESALSEDVLEQRIVVKDIYRPWMSAQRLLQIREYLPHSRLREWIKKINYQRIVGKWECGGIAAD